MAEEMRRTHCRQMVVNGLAMLGLLLYITLPYGEQLHLTAQDILLKRLAFSITCLVQIGRGLIWQLNLKRIPQWLALKKLDRSAIADTTVVFLIIWVSLEVCLRGSLGSQKDFPVFGPLTVGGLILGFWLFVLSCRKTSSAPGIALGAMLIFMVIFLSPWLLAAGIGYSLYRWQHVQGDREISILLAACSMPLLIATIHLFVKDQRNRWKNTQNVILTQLMALPSIPVFYFILKAFWPEQINPMFFPAVVTGLIYLPTFLARRTKPWLVKEKIEILEQEIVSDKKGKDACRSTDQVQHEIAKIRRELSIPLLELKKAEDHLDRGDAFWKLGNLEMELSFFELAKQSYEGAIESYNQVLQIAPDNRLARARKFQTAESLDELRRRQYQP